MRQGRISCDLVMVRATTPGDHITQHIDFRNSIRGWTMS